SAMCLAAFLYVGQLLPRYHTMRLLIVSYALQLVALTAITVLGLPLSPPGHPFEINAAEAPFRVMLAVLTVPAGALTAVVAWWSVRRWARRPEKKLSLRDIAKPRRVYLVIAAVVMLLYWPAVLENSGAIGYFGRILASALIVAPFLAGHDSHADRRLAVLWSVAILLNAMVGIAASARSIAFYAPVLFGSGYLSA